MNDDKEFHDKGISALYRKLPDEAPSADTDALIRAAARRAVSAAPRKTIFTVRVQRLLATAATMVLGIGLLAQWQREPEKLQEMVATAPAQSAAPAAEPSSQDISRSADAPDSATPAAAVSAEKRKVTSALKEKKSSKPAPASPAASSAGAVAAAPAPAPVQERMGEPHFLEREVEEKTAVADSAASAEAANASARLRATARADAEADAMKKQIPAASSILKNIAAKSESLAKDDSHLELKAYQQAMQDGNWAQAEIALGAASANESLQQRTDRHLLASLQQRTQPQTCTDLPAGEALLCQFIAQKDADKPLPADALAQLEKSGAISGVLTYRRTAVMKLLDKP